MTLSLNWRTREVLGHLIGWKIQGEKESARLKGRVFEVSLADLKTDQHEMNWRKIKLQVEAVEGSK